jgi:hypothetical protein
LNKSNIIEVDFSSRVTLSESDCKAVFDLSQRAAFLLHREMNQRIDVDFKDRRVGFAHVAVCPFRLGITVGSYSSIQGSCPEGTGLREWITQRDIAPRVIQVDVTADVEWLRDHALATEGDFGSEYANPEAASVEDAIVWIRRNCLRAPVDRVSPDELAAWDEKKVTIPDENGKLDKVSLNVAVKVYGPTYGYEICAATLITDHRISEKDAKLIVAAVKKVLPRRKEK